jgi:ribosomal protein S6--L-glutamate ligase
MTRLAVLTSRLDLPVHRELEQAAARAGHEIVILDALRCVAQAQPPRLLVYPDAGALAGVAAVLPRIGNWRADSALAALSALEAAGVPSLNASRAVRVGRDHWLTAQCLAAAGIAHPETVAGAEPLALAQAAALVCGVPCVVKHRRSRQGIGVLRCASVPELEAVLDSLWRVGEEVVVQRFCPPGGVCRRALVLAGEVLGATEHTAVAPEFRANAARGARVRAVALEAELAALALRAAQAVGLGFAGIDLLPDGTRWVVGEVNPSPGWTHFAAATGVAVAERVVAALARLGTQP